MIEFQKSLDVEAAVQTYRAEWQNLLAKHDLPQFRATTLSIKVADKPALYRILADNASNIEQLHIGTVNDRHIVSAVMMERVEGLTVLKILERRPDSSDRLGLDSIDYLVDDLTETFNILQSTGLPVMKERNDVHEWLSLRFGSDKRFEAKFTDHLVLAVAIKELQMSIDTLTRES